MRAKDVKIGVKTGVKTGVYAAPMTVIWKRDRMSVGVAFLSQMRDAKLKCCQHVSRSVTAIFGSSSKLSDANAPKLPRDDDFAGKLRQPLHMRGR